MPSELWQRLRAARKHKDLTQDQVADHFSISKAAVAQWESANAKNRTRPDINKLTEFGVLTGAPVSWLMDDTADLDAKDWREEEEEAAAYGMAPICAWEHPDDLPEGEYVLIPRLDVRLSAGPGGEQQLQLDFVKAQAQAFRTEWIRKRRLKPSKLAVMSANGDSMEERIQDGDALVVDTSQTDVLDGKVYALWYDGGERVKRLFRLPGGGLRIKSDNPTHGTIEMGPDYHGHVRIIGRVVQVAGEGGL